MGDRATMTEIVAAAEEVLFSGGYRRVGATELPSDWVRGRAYEDEYGVVGVFAYDTAADLDSQWTEAQEALVNLISRYMSRDEAKAWDGYLVLMTPGAPDSVMSSPITQIRQDTNRVRKLVATGADIGSLSDVRRALQGLLPLAPESGQQELTSAMDVLPGILAEHGIDRTVTSRLIDAFEQQEPMMRALHETKIP